MGRSAQSQTQAQIDQQLSQQNSMNQQLYSSGQALGSQAAAGYQNLVANPGYTDAQKSSITNLSQSALGSAFNALDSLARTQGQDSANLSAQNQIAFGNAARSDTQSGLSGLSGLYGTSSSLLGRALGVPSTLLDARVRNSQGSNFQLGFGPTGLTFGANG
jgi:hypothetical protein